MNQDTMLLDQILQAKLTFESIAISYLLTNSKYIINFYKIKLDYLSKIIELWYAKQVVLIYKNIFHTININIRLILN